MPILNVSEKPRSWEELRLFTVLVISIKALVIH
jgi:hypothetical protein